MVPRWVIETAHHRGMKIVDEIEDGDIKIECRFDEGSETYMVFGFNGSWSKFVWPVDENGVWQPMKRKPTIHEMFRFKRFVKNFEVEEYPPTPSD